MAENRIVAIANAVAWELNNPHEPRPFSLDFDAGRKKYLARVTAENLKALCVSVVPSNATTTPASRSTDLDDYKIAVAVQKKVTISNGEPDEGEMDSLLQLVQEITDFFRHRPLVEEPDAAWVGTETTPVYDVEHLDKVGVFTGLVQLTFREYR